MKIANLAEASGVHRSTIHHYLNLGLLPPPRALGPKLHLFGADHVACLAEIQKLRARGWPLTRIRGHLTHERLPRERPEAASKGVRPRLDVAQQRIVEHATRSFAERGYEGVRMSDVASSLGIGKATLYRHFPSKQALFVGCVEQVRYTLIPREARDINDGQSSFEEQGRSRARGVLAHFAAFRTLSNLLASVAHGQDAALAGKARTELHGMVTNAEPLLRRMIDAKLARPLDPELLAYMLWFALMGAGERLTLDGRFGSEQVLDAYMEFITLGLSGVPPERSPPPPSAPSRGTRHGKGSSSP